MNTRRFAIVAVVAILAAVCFGLANAQAAVDQWYQVTFTGADIWNMSPDNASQARTDQTAPRRYRDWTQLPNNPVQATTYGVADGGVYNGVTGGFNTWASTSLFAFDEINLWGKGGAAAAAWDENYVAVPDDADNGINSWKVLSAPTGWTDGIVLGNQPYNTGSGAFPVWRSGTGATLGIGPNDASFVFTFLVDVSNPDTAFAPDGKLRVFFGGFSDDLQGAGDDNYEVSGVMELTATPIPEPATLIVWSLLGAASWMGMRVVSRKRTA